LNFKTYLKSSSASASAGKEPPSRKGVMYRVTFTVLRWGVFSIIELDKAILLGYKLTNKWGKIHL
jgi:hypothetical protein